MLQMAASEKSPTVRVLELVSNGNYDSKLFKLKTGWVLRFTLAPYLYPSSIHLYTDYPAPGNLYERGRMHELIWTSSIACRRETWDPDRFIEIELTSAGPYRFNYTKAEGDAMEQEGSGYFLVEPDLGYSPEGICCQTYITKLMGPFQEWKKRLRVGKEAGYNMFHFTPMQQLGSSRSAYSISNHLRMDSSYFKLGHTSTNETSVTYIDQTGIKRQLKVDNSYVMMHDLVKTIQKDWGILGLVDVVWNHTAFDTPWLQQHPEVGYNMVNSPHLRPAYALDVTLYRFSCEIAERQWVQRGIHPEIRHEGDVSNIRDRLLDTILPQAQLWQYFSVDVEKIVSNFRAAVYHLNGGSHPRPHGKSLSIVQDPKYKRLGCTVDMELALELFNVDWPGLTCFEERIENCCKDLREELHRLNAEVQDRVSGQLHHTVSNLSADTRYQFLEGHGPKRSSITIDSPLFPRYFTVVDGGYDLSWTDLESKRGEFILAHNGWVMNADPLVNFAAEGSTVYFQRELIVWGDSIKLNYGRVPSDSPWLWKYMRCYTQVMAWIFAGFRIDNCHNTPVNVAEMLLDAARAVNPNLYLVAELFTSSEERDNYYVNRLGINSLIREAMSAPYARELGRLVYRYGGEPVASFLPASSNPVLKHTTTNALFMDATHDNDPGHILSRSVYDALPNTALMAIASCASGSCRGYDELVPHMINVVTEPRVYSRWKEQVQGTVTMDTGIIQAKKELNLLHQQLADEGFNQIYVDQVTEEIVAVTRHCPSSHQSVILMAHTAFYHPESWAIPTTLNPQTHYSHVPPLTVPGAVMEVVLEARLVKKSEEEFVKSSLYINGMDSHVLDMRKHIQLEDSKFCHLVSHGSAHEVQFYEFCPGSIIVFRVSLIEEAGAAIQIIRSFLGQHCTTNIEGGVDGCVLRKEVTGYIEKLDLLDLNYALYRCDKEEREDGNGGGAYEVPGAGRLVYCGLQGIISVISKVRDNNDLGHPICDNLRAGDWMAVYTINRLRLRDGTKAMAVPFGIIFTQMSKLPQYLIPCYFEAVVTTIYTLLTQSAVAKMGSFVENGSSFVKRLALGSVQLFGVSSSARLPPPTDGEEFDASLAAGLPHFSTGFMRCWGRDTFIALRGMLMVTARYQDARANILSFAACLRHGLLPNLLNGGNNPRYNCRDAPWWWLQSVQDYVSLAPGGVEILSADVRKLYRDDEAEVNFSSTETVTLREVMHEIVQRHMDGIKFRERGSGPNLDKDMTPPGFDVRAGVNVHTGFIYGGSVHNCGTWMDKVGESSWAGNKGIPSTPRDGSAVELVGLCYSAVNFLAKLHKKSIHPHPGVHMKAAAVGDSPKVLHFSEWAELIKTNFEANFWIPLDKTEASAREGEKANVIHRLGIYKDSVGATQRYADFQLRPNFPIAMVVAPDLFTPSNAWEALCKTEDLLLGPLGMKTLDPEDYVYNGYYMNSVDSSDFHTAKGFNYHQGPEWLWVVGYFLRAKLQFSRLNSLPVDDTISSIHHVLGYHAQALRDSPWQGLPELTNKDGAECSDSCPTQAWSMATLLDVLLDLAQVK